MLVRDKAARKQWKKDEKLGTFSLMVFSVCTRTILTRTFTRKSIRLFSTHSDD